MYVLILISLKSIHSESFKGSFRVATVEGDARFNHKSRAIIHKVEPLLPVAERCSVHPSFGCSAALATKVVAAVCHEPTFAWAKPLEASSAAMPLLSAFLMSAGF